MKCIGQTISFKYEKKCWNYENIIRVFYKTLLKSAERAEQNFANVSLQIILQMVHYIQQTEQNIIKIIEVG